MTLEERLLEATAAIKQWMYACFKTRVDDAECMRALLDDVEAECGIPTDHQIQLLVTGAPGHSPMTLRLQFPWLSLFISGELT